jgi:hypothetical protein
MERYEHIWEVLWTVELRVSERWLVEGETKGNLFVLP